MSLAAVNDMDTDQTLEPPNDRGEKKAGSAHTKVERSDPGSDVNDTDVANAADEAGSAFLPRDKVLSTPDKHK
jgi:hypothetical protein